MRRLSYFSMLLAVLIAGLPLPRATVLAADNPAGEKVYELRIYHITPWVAQSGGVRPNFSHLKPIERNPAANGAIALP